MPHDDNDPILNCASGACCRQGSAAQLGALATVIAQADTSLAEDACYRIAKHLTAQSLIGLPIAGAAFARWVRWSLAGTPPGVPGEASPNAGPVGAE